MLIIVEHKWRLYLFGQPFKVKTIQQSLKYLLEQKIETSLQQKQFSMLLGYQVLVEYKARKENKVADILSKKAKGLTKREIKIEELWAITILLVQWVKNLHRSYAINFKNQQIF